MPDVSCRQTDRQPALSAVRSVPEVEPPELTRHAEIVWLEPYPDVLLESVMDLGLARLLPG